ncbi:hypothetical protein AKJ09_09216 [Labilithrix luteola]|uniref:Uncharacterized protein n=1 Tax=Labilithrix luteola TaxID=1391654 RepID=A0A0K1Q9Y8_9BACT|nr:hypothetical protein AKJ09_09216 [Labilithrix luteola]
MGRQGPTVVRATSGTASFRMLAPPFAVFCDNLPDEPP